jgi:small-conductance mechanosensitive channel
MGDAVKRLEKTAQQQAAAAPKEDPKLREELGRLRQLAASAGEQLNSCQLRLTAMETRQQQARTPPPAEAEQVVAKSDPQPVPVNAGSLIFSDSFYLKKDETKAIQDVNLAVALIGVSSRSARVEINKQPVSVAFGERKEIVYNSMTCEFSLIETDLNASQARFSLSCKR